MLTVVVERDDRDAVVQLEVVAVGSIVYQHHLAEFTIANHPEILDVHARFGLEAVLSEQPM